MVIRAAFPALTALLLGACSSLEFPGVYRLPIEQGNIITEEMVAQLEPGMTPSQVEFVLGHALAKSPFTPNRWDYVYRIRHSDKSVDRERLTVFFEDGELSRYVTTVVPDNQQDEPTELTRQDSENEELLEEAEEEAKHLRRGEKQDKKLETPPPADIPKPGPEPGY